MTHPPTPAAPSGSEAQFAEFVRANSTSLFRTAVLLTGAHHSAEDLVQETLTYLYARWDRVMQADAPLAYVRRSLANRFVSSRRVASSRDIGVWDLPDRPDGRDVAETVAVQRTVWQLLGELPERQRAALVLRYFHDLTDEQIADSLECRPVTVRSLVSRGTAAMRTALAASAATGSETK